MANQKKIEEMKLNFICHSILSTVKNHRNLFKWHEKRILKNVVNNKMGDKKVKIETKKKTPVSESGRNFMMLLDVHFRSSFYERRQKNHNIFSMLLFSAHLVGTKLLLLHEVRKSEIKIKPFSFSTVNGNEIFFVRSGADFFSAIVYLTKHGL